MLVRLMDEAGVVRLGHRTPHRNGWYSGERLLGLLPSIVASVLLVAYERPTVDGVRLGKLDAVRWFPHGAGGGTGYHGGSGTLRASSMHIHQFNDAYVAHYDVERRDQVICK